MYKDNVTDNIFGMRTVSIRGIKVPAGSLSNMLENGVSIIQSWEAIRRTAIIHELDHNVEFSCQKS